MAYHRLVRWALTGDEINFGTRLKQNLEKVAVRSIDTRTKSDTGG